VLGVMRFELVLLVGGYVYTVDASASVKEVRMGGVQWE
jgi:hypothetical protein